MSGSEGKINWETETWCGCLIRQKVYAVLWTFEAKEGTNEITLKQGEQVYIVMDEYWENNSWRWAFVQKKRDKDVTGIIPRAFLAPLSLCKNSKTFSGTWYIGKKTEEQLDAQSRALCTREAEGAFIVCEQEKKEDQKYEEFLLLVREAKSVRRIKIGRDPKGRYKVEGDDGLLSNLFVAIQYLKINPDKIGGVRLSSGMVGPRVGGEEKQKNWWKKHTIPAPPIFGDRCEKNEPYLKPNFSVKLKQKPSNV